MVFKPLKFLNRSTTELQVEFSAPISADISTANVAVRSDTPNVADLTIKGVFVEDNVLSVLTNEQVPFALYHLVMFSTSSQNFESINGDIIQESGSLNRIDFVGLEDANRVRDDLFAATPPVYNVERDTFVRKHLSNVAEQLLRARTDIREVGSANYISVEVENEIRRRGFSPTDRLANEGAYQITRVGLTATDASQVRVVNFNLNRATAILGSSYENVNDQITSFPADPVSLRSINIINERVSNASTLSNSFDRHIITLSKPNIAQINSIVLNKSDGSTFVYDINVYGYALLDNRYDTLNGRQLLTLDSNQFRLSDTVIQEGGFALPTGSDTLDVSYSYLDNGVDVDSDTIALTQVKEKVREQVGSFLVTFFLTGFPIVTAGDATPTSGGVTFLDPNPPSGLPFTQSHPAFRNEIPFSETRLPSKAGEFAIEYSTGRVAVFGASTNNGTGDNPPVASYFFRKTFQEGIDYDFDADSDEIAANASRSLISKEVKLTYDFQQVLAEGDDYISEVHNEVINERVENRLVSTLRVATQNSPITNVFRVFNETTGEIYGISRFDDNYITIAGRNPPRQLTKKNENVSFERVFNESLLVSEEIEVGSTYKIIRIDLLNDKVVGDTPNRLGANFNTSVGFTTDDIFIREFFYDGVLQSVSTNLGKLSANGDYLIDYDNGVIYLQTALTTEDFGEINYTHGSIDTQFSNILSPEQLVYRHTTNDDVILRLTTPSFTAERIQVDGLRPAGERFVNDDTDRLLAFGSKLNGIAGQRTKGSTRFVALDAVFTSDHADGNHILRFPDDADRQVVGFISMTEVVVDVAFTDNDKQVSWVLIDFDLSDGDGYNAATTYPILSVRGVYDVSSLQSVDSSSLTNLFDPDVDTFSDNVITFNSDPIKSISPGTSLIVDYSVGNLYIDYTYVADNLLVSYEWGDNSINHSISNAVDQGQEYFVSYKYGALRDALLTNFGALTQIEELVDFPLDFDRELYRSAVAGALQSFVKGPTKEALRIAVSEITDVDPNITELSFNEWTADRDNLYLQEGVLTGEETYEDGKFGLGLLVEGDTTFVFPSEAYLSLREGTFEAWARPNWRGLDNDASLTFSIGQDGYEAGDGYGLQTGNRIALEDIYIGASGFNPAESPFTINRADPDPNSPVGRPTNFGAAPGFFIWYDADRNEWFFRAVGDPLTPINFTGTITTTGKFYNVRDGYNFGANIFINEINDALTSISNRIDFSVNMDGYDISSTDGYVSIIDGYQLYQDGLNFLSDDTHYLIDTGPDEAHNRLSIFKDPFGYLNFRVFDDSGFKRPGTARQFNLSTNISNWLAGELHHIGASWRFNSSEGIDEMHLFVDGQEVSNLFKYGGRPLATEDNVYRTVADEILTTSVPKNIVGGFDGETEAGSTTFISASSDFVAAGIVPGDSFTILDATADSLIARSVVSVSTTSLVVDVAFTLTLENVSFAVNQLSFNTETLLSVENFAAFRIPDGYEDAVELDGLEAETPDYTIEKEGQENTINFNNNVLEGDTLFINTLGLTRGRSREIIYNYSNDHILRTNLEPPTDLSDVDIFKLIVKRMAIIEDGYHSPGDGYGDGFWQADGYELDGYFTDLCQPSNQVRGKKMRITLGGTNNINFSATNEVIIRGKTFSGAIQEVVLFNNYGTEITDEYFTEIDHIEATFTGFRIGESFGSLEVIENTSLTREENNGDYAQVGNYDNGQFKLFVFGSGGTEFDLDPCWYLLDYPTRLNIPVSRKGPLYLGSDINGGNQWAGVLDDVVFLNEMLEDVRAGEVPATNTRTITRDFNSPRAKELTSQTLMLLDLDGDTKNIDTFYKTYVEDYLTNSRSVNENFGDCAVFFDETPLVIDNGPVVLDNDQGTIEFWVSPFIDILNDMDHTRYYVDMSAATIEEVVSLTAVSVQISRRARSITSVRLTSDDGTGVNYFEGGSLGLDGKTITLGRSLPGQQTLVKVQYTSIDSTGDRLSIYKDGYGHLNFELLASEQVYTISYPIAWERNSWHRVMATWDLNNLDNQDRIRLFVDGQEGGTILYGAPGVLYGIGLLYGSAPVGTLSSRFLTTNIDFTDTIGNIVVGNSFDRANPGKIRVDNLRFSNVVRDPAVVAGTPVDLNFNANLAAVLPVIEDASTTAIYDFNKEVEQTEFLSNLLGETTPLFNFDVDVIDSFGRIEGNERAQNLVRSLINRIKPAHTDALVSFL